MHVYVNVSVCCCCCYFYILLHLYTFSLFSYSLLLSLSTRIKTEVVKERNIYFMMRIEEKKVRCALKRLSQLQQQERGHPYLLHLQCKVMQVQSQRQVIRSTTTKNY